MFVPIGRRLNWIRAACVAGMLLVTLSAALPAAAAPPPNLGFFQPRFAGIVTAVDPPTDSPSTFTLQLGVDSIDIRINARTVFMPKSVEARVEGFSAQDYAVVVAAHARGGWVARKLQFDVQPFGPLRLFNGTLVKIAPKARRIAIDLTPSGRFQQIRMVKATSFLIDGKPTDSLTFAVAAQAAPIQVLALKLNAGWTAFDVSNKTIPPTRFVPRITGRG